MTTGEVKDVTDDATAAAAKIATACEFLPLYLSICGEIIRQYEVSDE